MDRREALATSGAILTTILSGCSVPNSSDKEGVILTEVHLGNSTGEPQTFHVKVNHNGEIIHQSDHEVPVGDNEREGGGKVIRIDAADEPGDFEVQAEVDGKSRTIDFDSEYERREYGGERVIAIFMYGFRGDGEQSALTSSTLLLDQDDQTNTS